jgi:hypothetical protein
VTNLYIIIYIYLNVAVPVGLADVMVNNLPVGLADVTVNNLNSLSGNFKHSSFRHFVTAKILRFVQC